MKHYSKALKHYSKALDGLELVFGSLDGLTDDDAKAIACICDAANLTIRSMLKKRGDTTLEDIPLKQKANATCEICKKPVKLITVHHGYCCGRRQTLVEDKS